jgi:plasmid stabilization system protein ParE
MLRGDKSKYTPKQKRKAEHIEASYEERGLDPGEAEARAWATVNKQSGGGEQPGGSGRKKSPAQKAHAREDSARRAVATKHGHSPNRGRMTARRARHAST